MLRAGRLVLLLGIISMTYGFARWQITSEIVARQRHAFDLHAERQAGQDDLGWRKVSSLAIAVHPGWPQAIVPCVLGGILLAIGDYLKKKASLTA